LRNKDEKSSNMKIKIYGQGQKVWLMTNMVIAIDLPWKSNDVMLEYKTIDHARVNYNIVSKKIMEITVNYTFKDGRPIFGADSDKIFRSLIHAKSVAKYKGYRIVNILNKKGIK
jgi:hypothetical protein